MLTVGSWVITVNFLSPAACMGQEAAPFSPLAPGITSAGAKYHICILSRPVSKNANAVLMQRAALSQPTTALGLQPQH